MTVNLSKNSFWLEIFPKSCSWQVEHSWLERFFTFFSKTKKDFFLFSLTLTQTWNLISNLTSVTWTSKLWFLALTWTWTWRLKSIIIILLSYCVCAEMGFLTARPTITLSLGSGVRAAADTSVAEFWRWGLLDVNFIPAWVCVCVGQMGMCVCVSIKSLSKTQLPQWTSQCWLVTLQLCSRHKDTFLSPLPSPPNLLPLHCHSGSFFHFSFLSCSIFPLLFFPSLPSLPSILHPFILFRSSLYSDFIMVPSIFFIRVFVFYHTFSVYHIFLFFLDSFLSSFLFYFSPTLCIITSCDASESHPVCLPSFFILYVLLFFLFFPHFFTI